MLPLLLLLSALIGPSQEEPRLVRAAKLLQKSPEQDCRDGVELCVAEDSVAAVELLLEVLALETDRGGFLPSAHYRDVAWGGLARITDPAARARVQQTLEESKKSPRLRQWCAELLGEYGDPGFAAALAQALKDKDLEVQRAAARALGKLRFPDVDPAPASDAKPPRSPRAEAFADLVRLAKDKDPMLRANALEACARLDATRGREALVKGLADKDGGVRCALLGAAAEIYPDEAEALAQAALEDEDWRPRMQAVDVLAGRRSAAATGLLVRALADARPAIVSRAVRHLQALTGQLHTRREAWEAWWRDEGEGFDYSRPAAARERPRDSTVATFDGIELHSDHVAFLIDRSSGMSAALQSRSCSKEEAARAELDAVLTRLLGGGLRFSLFTYSDRVVAFDERGPVELGPRTQEKALGFVQEERLGGSKDIWQALETALADPDVDTLFLLSSGEPDVGLYVHWNRVTWHLAELNRFHKAVVHAIAYSDSAWYREQLQKIAEVTGGEFQHFE